MVKNVRDAVVVGGGPAGSSCAFYLAKQGLEVTVFEEHKTVGVPSHCAGHLSIRGLRNIGLYPLPKGVVENVFSAANFYSPNGVRFSVHFKQPVTCAVNRILFDRLLASRAQIAGAKFHLGARVESLILDQGFVKGVNVAEAGETDTRVPARLVVDAEGISSRLLRQTGLQALDCGKLVYAVEAEVENVQDFEEHAVEVYVGRAYAPGFYSWLIPRLDGSAKVGLATESGNPKDYFDRLMHKHPVASRQLRDAKVKSLSFHAISLGGLIPRAFADGFLALGDCASQVKPTTGGGVIFSLISAKCAAEVAGDCLARGDVSSNSLRLYNKRVTERLGFDTKAMLRARSAINALSDKKLDAAIIFANRVGLERTLSDVDEIDFQGQTMLALLRQPAAYAMLAYLLWLLLPANA